MFSVRLAKAADAKKIARLRVETLYAADRNQLPNGALNARTIKRREAFWNARFAQAKGWVYVIESGDVVGFCDLIPSHDKDTDPKTIAEIAAIFAAADHWQLGAGKVLCYHVMAQARTRGCQELIVWVLGSNSHAMRFYESLGFARDGSIKIVTAADGRNAYEFRYRLKLNRT
ncbi:MAG TPA: GNAT family N-acetyltransferase [Verrucomicrobiae bacterium]|jgi:GNAT superfamily N-acetyltransferase|nr:GNAT family N-acetyltransferase [Verrucomicrobiae bacterium]